MANASLFFATNRKHKSSGSKKGTDEGRWQPDGYGGSFSSNGRHNLRFGKITVPYSVTEVDRHLTKSKHGAVGDGEELSKYFKGMVGKNQISAYPDKSHEDGLVGPIQFDDSASTKAFRDIKKRMEGDPATDVLIFIHGFNVSWEDAVGSALALQFMLNRERKEGDKEVMVVLFSWPSNGKIIPFASYFSDQSDSRASGPAVGRAILKLHFYLTTLKQNARDGAVKLCNQNIHLLCHSKGNYVLQNAMETLHEETTGYNLPNIFKHVFMCAADVDDDVLEPGQPMGKLKELTKDISVYFNQGDLAMDAAEITKGKDDRLGQSGVANEYNIHRKIHQIDCSQSVKGFLEHSYFLWGLVAQDIRSTIDDIPQAGRDKHRRNAHRNSWELSVKPK